jgi:hypothetical protein
MALPVFGAAGALTYLSGATINITPTMVTGFSAGDLLLIAVGVKPDTSTVNTPSGWTKIGEFSGGGGTTGIDTGPTKVLWFYKIAAGGDSAPTINITSTNVSWAQTMYATESSDTFDLAAAGGADSTTGTAWSVTCSTDPGLTVDDLVLVASCIPTDVTTPAQFSAEAVSATGVSAWGTVTELSEPDTNLGNDIGGFIFYVPVVTGTSTAAPVITATAGGTTTNVRGPSSLLRIRGASTTPVGKDLQLIWNVQATIGKNLQLIWNDRAPIAKNLQLVWNSLTSVNKNLQLIWNNLTSVNKTLQFIWNDRSLASKDLQLIWNVLELGLTAVGKDLQLIWNDRALIGKNLQVIWNDRAVVNKNLQLVWNVRTTVNKTLQLVWNDRSLVNKDIQLIWNDRATVGKSAQLTWNVNSTIGKTLQLIWNDNTAVGKNVQLVWNVRSAIGKELILVWNVNQNVAWVETVVPGRSWAEQAASAASYVEQSVAAGTYSEVTRPNGTWIEVTVGSNTWS